MSRQTTPIEHKVIEGKILRKKRRTMADAMEMQSNITTLMGNMQHSYEQDVDNES